MNRERTEKTNPIIDSYFRVIEAQRTNKIEYLSNQSWAMVGCGAWLKTSDNMLLVSRRTRVYEEKGNIGYSSAGSCDRRIGENDADPFSIICKETKEEVGEKYAPKSLEDFLLISIGIDISRCLIQFSFFAEMNCTASEAISEFENDAQSSYEQELFAVPFEKQMINDLIKNYQMESGAIYSLHRLIQKHLDNSTGSMNISKDAGEIKDNALAVFL